MEKLGSQSAAKEDLVQSFQNEKKETKLSINQIDTDSDVAIIKEEGEYSSDWHNIVDWDLQVRLEAGLIAFYSPYPEVRSVTEPFDDPNMPCETIRVYILGIIWCGIGAFINQFFSQRQPPINLTSAIVQVFLYPCGICLHWILPKYKFKIWKYTIDLNPGPWTQKEQMLTTLFYSVSGSAVYVNSNIEDQKIKVFYNDQWLNMGYDICLMLSTNFIGFGLAGIIRKFAVYPVQSVWPSVFPTLAVNKALMQGEKKENIYGWKISRYNFFFIVCIASFFYFWIPDYLFTAMSTFNWLSWIKPDNLNLANITGSVLGLGINPIPTFDWNVLNFCSPLALPFFNQVNTYVGGVLGFFCIVAVWYSNFKWTKYLPINANSLYTNTGESYSVTEILSSDGLFKQELYDSYGPPFYSAGNLVMYGAFFAIYPFGFLYEIIINWKPISFAIAQLFSMMKNRKQSTYDGFNDPFSRQMKKYNEVPEWWFSCFLVASVVLAILCVKLYPMETPVWTIFFAIGINFLFLIPITAIYSRTGFSYALNVLVELIIGYALMI